MKKTLFFGMFILIQSCVIKSNMVSNKQAGYRIKPKKIYVLFISTDETNNFCQGLFAGIIQDFKGKGIVTSGLIRNHQLNAPEYSKLYANNPTGAILTIVLDETQVLDHGPNGGKFEFTLTDEQSGKDVWTGTLTVNGHLDSSAAIKSGVESVIKKMEDDGII